jgi:diacylglycerol kinase (ATP)
MSETLVVVNPASASGRTGRKWPSLSQKVKEKLPLAKIHLTQEKHEATNVVRQAIQSGVKKIVSVGGDGTHHEVINGFLDENAKLIAKDVALALLPMGTGSDLCKSLGIPNDPQIAIDLMFKHLKPIDLGMSHFIDPQGKPSTQAFLNIGSFGLSAEVGKQLELRSKANKLSYLSGIYHASAVYQNQEVHLKLIQKDSTKEIKTKLYLCAIGNGRFFGGGMKITPSAYLNDGQFEVAVLGDLNAFEVVSRIPLLFMGKHIGTSKIESFDALSIEATAQNPKEIWIELDGEPVGTLPAQFDILPSAIQLSIGDQKPAFKSIN